MSEAEKAGVGKSVRRKGWFSIGLQEGEKGNHPAAIIALNSARILESNPNETLVRMLEEVEAFCQDFKGRFSRQDLRMVSEGLGRVESFYRYHSKVAAVFLDKLKSLEQWINGQLVDAPDREETPVTPHVQRIYAALYPAMSIEEGRAEFARIVEPMMRERLQSKSKPAAAGGGRKGPKDPDDDEGEGPPEEPPKPKRKPNKA